LVGADCDACGAALIPVGESEHGGIYGFVDALRVTIGGGYGEYIDGGGSTIICGACADKLKSVQLLAAAFKEACD